MRREDLLELFKRIPERMHQYVNLVMRGREGGSTDEGRGFFVPYDEIAYVRVEQVLKVGDLKRLYGEAYADIEDTLGQQAEAEAAAKAEAEAKGQPQPDVTTTPPPATAPTDPASIAKQNLLDRIRAARANAAGATGRLK